MSVPHTLSQEEATRRLREQIQSARSSFSEHVQNFEEHWEGNTLAFSFTTFGFKVKGTLNSEPSAVQVNADLPMAALMFKGMIEQQVREQLGRVLA
jgi:hypothetical protein